MTDLTLPPCTIKPCNENFWCYSVLFGAVWRYLVQKNIFEEDPSLPYCPLDRSLVLRNCSALGADYEITTRSRPDERDYRARTST